MARSPPKTDTEEVPAKFVERLKSKSKKRVVVLKVPPYWSVEDLRRHTDILQSSVRHTRSSFKAISSVEIALQASGSSTSASANVPPLEIRPERDVLVVDPLEEVQRPGGSASALEAEAQPSEASNSNSNSTVDSGEEVQQEGTSVSDSAAGSVIESGAGSGSSIQVITREASLESEGPLDEPVQEEPAAVVEPTEAPELTVDQEPEQEPEQEIVQEPETEPEQRIAQETVYIADPQGEPVIVVEPIFEEVPTPQAQPTSVAKVAPRRPCDCKDCRPELLCDCKDCKPKLHVVAKAPEVSPGRIQGIFSALAQGVKQVGDSVFNKEVLLPVVGEDSILERESTPVQSSDQVIPVEPEITAKPSTPENPNPELEVIEPTDSQEQEADTTDLYSTPCAEPPTTRTKPWFWIPFGSNKGSRPFEAPLSEPDFSTPVAGTSDQATSEMSKQRTAFSRDIQDFQESGSVEDIYYYYSSNRFCVVDHDFKEVLEFANVETERFDNARSASMDYGTMELTDLERTVNNLEQFQVFQRRVMNDLRQFGKSVYHLQLKVLAITRLILTAQQRILVKTRPGAALEAAAEGATSSPAAVDASGQPPGSVEGASASVENQQGSDQLTSAERLELIKLRLAAQGSQKGSDRAQPSKARDQRSRKPASSGVASRLGPRQERRAPTSPSGSSSTSNESDDSPPRRGHGRDPRRDPDPARDPDQDQDLEGNPDENRDQDRRHGHGRRHGHRRHRVTYTRRQPVLTVKPFKGEKRDYIRFRTAFKDTYENVGLSRMPLAIHLAEHLQGEAGTRFGNMANAPTRHTYRAMWTALDAFYGTERELTMDRLDRFNQLPVIKSFSPATISMLFGLFSDIWPALEADLGDRIYDETHLTFHTFLKKIPLDEVAKYRAFCRATHQQRCFDTFREWLEEQWATYKNARSKDMGSVDRNLVLWQNEMEDSSDRVLLATHRPHSSVQLEGWSTSDFQVDEDGSTYLEIPVPANSYYNFVDGELQPIGSVVLKQQPQRGRGGRGGRGGFGFPRGGAKPLPPPRNGKDGQSFPKQSGDCLHCRDKDHPIFQCPKFEKLDLKEKYKIVRDKKLCIRCLKTGHFARDCQIRFVCNVDRCGKRHHRFLHPYNSKALKSYLSMAQEQGLDEDLTSHSDED